MISCCRQRLRGRPPRDTGALLLDHVPDDAKNMYKLVEVRHALPNQCPGCYGEGDYQYPPPDPSALNSTSSKVGVCEPIQMYDPHQYDRFEGGGKLNTGVSTGSGQREHVARSTEDIVRAEGNMENSRNSLVEQQQREQLQHQIQQQPIPPEEEVLAESGHPLPPGAVACECANCHACALESPYTIDNWKPQDVYLSIVRQQQQQAENGTVSTEPPDVTQHDSTSGGGGGGGSAGAPKPKTYGTMKGRTVSGVEYRQIPSVSLNAELRYFGK